MILYLLKYHLLIGFVCTPVAIFLTQEGKSKYFNPITYFYCSVGGYITFLSLLVMAYAYMKSDGDRRKYSCLDCKLVIPKYFASMMQNIKVSEGLCCPSCGHLNLEPYNFRKHFLNLSFEELEEFKQFFIKSNVEKQNYLDAINNIDLQKEDIYIASKGELIDFWQRLRIRGKKELKGVNITSIAHVYEQTLFNPDAESRGIANRIYEKMRTLFNEMN